MAKKLRVIFQLKCASAIILAAIVREAQNIVLSWGKIPRTHENWILTVEWGLDFKQFC